MTIPAFTGNPLPLVGTRARGTTRPGDAVALIAATGSPGGHRSRP